MAILTLPEIAKKFKQSRTTVTQNFRRPGSPAFKKGTQEKSPWQCDDEKYEKYLLALAEEFKG